MKRFRFRLQRLLDVEEQREDQAKMKLQSMINKLHGQEKILQFLNVSLWHGQHALADRRLAVTDARQLSLYYNYLFALEERISHQTIIVNEAGKEVEVFRNELLEVQKRRKMLQRLRDKDKGEYISSARKIEMKYADEISIQRESLRRGLNQRPSA